MTQNAKIVITVVNMGCLLVTLIFPDDMNPFSVMIAIVPLCAWAFDTYHSRTHSKFGLSVYVSVVSILAVVCLVIGICTNVVIVDNQNQIVTEINDAFSHYAIRVKQGASVLSGKMFDYTTIAIIEFFVVLMLSAIDIHATRDDERLYDTTRKPNQMLSIIAIIDNEIGHIK